MEVFDLNNYIGEDYVMRCDTREKAQFFLRYLHSMGRTWTNGTSYVSHDNWGSYTYETVYYFNKGVYGSLPTAIECEKHILEFDDFDWSKASIIVATFKPGDRVRVRSNAKFAGMTGVVRVNSRERFFGWRRVW